MLHLLSGHVAFEIDGGERVDVSKPTLVLFASDKPSSGVNYVYPGKRFLMLSVSCGHEFLQKVGGNHLARFSNELLSDYSVPDQGAYMMTFPLPMRLRGIAEDVINCRIQNAHAEALFYRSKTLECLAYIIELSEQNNKPIPSFKETDKLKLSRAKQLLEDEFELGWSIASLAKEVGLNEKKLKSGFRHIIGKTVNEYHRTIRMEAAKKMLLDREPVTQVALATGFSSLSHFSKTFKECYGVLPSQYARCQLL